MCILSVLGLKYYVDHVLLLTVVDNIQIFTILNISDST